uniref:Putative secreted protein n=1 Tax=Anopheles marajoara TaxID=58244 RepID=A0A2M4C6J1_9DIPT
MRRKFVRVLWHLVPQQPMAALEYTLMIFHLRHARSLQIHLTPLALPRLHCTMLKLLEQLMKSTKRQATLAVLMQMTDLQIPALSILLRYPPLPGIRIYAFGLASAMMVDTLRSEQAMQTQLMARHDCHQDWTYLLLGYHLPGL